MDLPPARGAAPALDAVCERASSPKQLSQRDGLGRMCKVHWNASTAGLAREAKVRKAAQTTPAEDASPPQSEPQGGRTAKPQLAAGGGARQA